MHHKFHFLPLLLCLIFPAMAEAYPEKALVPGGIALLALPDYQEGTKVTFDNKQIAVFPYKNTWVAMAGIPLDAKPGNYQFSIKHHTGITLNTRVTVKDKKYQEQHLTIKNKRKVNPNEEDMVRIKKERIRKQKPKPYEQTPYPKSISYGPPKATSVAYSACVVFSMDRNAVLTMAWTSPPIPARQSGPPPMAR